MYVQVSDFEVMYYTGVWLIVIELFAANLDFSGPVGKYPGTR